MKQREVMQVTEKKEVIVVNTAFLAFVEENRSRKHLLNGDSFARHIVSLFGDRTLFFVMRRVSYF